MNQKCINHRRKGIQVMSINVHFVNPNLEKENCQMVADLITLLALKRLMLEHHS